MERQTDTFTVRVSYGYDPLQAGSPEIEEIEAIIQEAIESHLRELSDTTVTDVYDVEVGHIDVRPGVFVAPVVWSD